MGFNMLTAIQNIIRYPVAELHSFYASHNRANSMGEALELYIKDAFADTLLETDEQIRDQKFKQVFSYTGSQNNPPDIMIRGGDAIEVKKIESSTSQLALNSSYPKAKLYADNSMIVEKCRACEQWSVKDIIYAVGVVNKNHLSRLFFVYGVDYAARPEIYESIIMVAKRGIASVFGAGLAQTDELGRLNKVDPLGLTYMRMRGMWGIENPLKVFNYVLPSNSPCDFQLTAIINNNKYYSFPDEDRAALEAMASSGSPAQGTQGLSISDIKIKSPDNPSILKDAKLIYYTRRK